MREIRKVEFWLKHVPMIPNSGSLENNTADTSVYRMKDAIINCELWGK